MARESDAPNLATQLAALSTAGFEPKENALPEISERLGFKVQRKPGATQPGFGGFFPEAMYAKTPTLNERDNGAAR